MELSEPDKQIFESMQPYRVPFTVSSGIEVRMASIYRNMHGWDKLEASNNMEMINSRTICRMCLMSTKVCRVYGANLKKYEMELHGKAKDAYERRLRMYKLVQRQARVKP